MAVTTCRLIACTNINVVLTEHLSKGHVLKDQITTCNVEIWYYDVHVCVCSQNRGLDEREAKVVSFLFNLLVKAVKRLSQFEVYESRLELSAADEDQLCGLLELVVDKWLIERVFLNTGWLAHMMQLGEHSVEQKKKRRRKSSIDYKCSSQVVELLHVAIESWSIFRKSSVVRLAVARMLSGSKSLLVGAQHDGTISKGVCVCVCVYTGFFTGFFIRGEFIVCDDILKLGGLGACPPRKNLKFMTSETASGGF